MQLITLVFVNNIEYYRLQFWPSSIYERFKFWFCFQIGYDLFVYQFNFTNAIQLKCDFLRSFDKTEAYYHGQNIVDKFSYLSKIGVTLECFKGDFSQFSSTVVEIWLLGGRWRFSINSKVFVGIYWKFPNFLSSTLNLFGNLCGNSYINLSVIIIYTMFPLYRIAVGSVP